MAIADRLSRYRDFARFLAKYARSDVVTQPDPDHIQHQAALSEADAQAFARDIESLGPTFIKLGQMLSTRAELLPPAYVEALTRLQDDVEPFPFADVLVIIEDELGVRLSKAFVEFDEKPIAAASLGQVHRAVLRSGRSVAVKVQRPQARERVLQDIEALGDIAVLFNRFSGVSRTLDVRRVLEEFRRTVLRELDYQQEARNLLTVAARLRDLEHIVVPVPVSDYTSTRVLTMNFIAGTKITKVSPVEWTEVDGEALAKICFARTCSRFSSTASSTPTRIQATCC